MIANDLYFNDDTFTHIYISKFNKVKQKKETTVEELMKSIAIEL